MPARQDYHNEEFCQDTQTLCLYNNNKFKCAVPMQRIRPVQKENALYNNKFKMRCAEKKFIMRCAYAHAVQCYCLKLTVHFLSSHDMYKLSNRSVAKKR